MKHNMARRLSPAVRIGLMLVLSVGLVFVLGVIVGFSVSMAEHGRAPHQPLAYVFLGAMIVAGAAMIWAMTALVRAWRGDDGMSGFDKRYYRMLGIIVALGVPVGIGLAIASDSGDPLKGDFAMFSNSAIDPTIAIAIAFLATILLAVSAVIYHRTIDDHEERAYLWGSTIAFYFLAIAFPVAWLLARGGLIDALGIGAAMIILLMSVVIQGAVWLWFKFR